MYNKVKIHIIQQRATINLSINNDMHNQTDEVRITIHYYVKYKSIRQHHLYNRPVPLFPISLFSTGDRSFTL